MQDYRK